VSGDGLTPDGAGGRGARGAAQGGVGVGGGAGPGGGVRLEHSRTQVRDEKLKAEELYG
jgi:hypothetical protein